LSRRGQKGFDFHSFHLFVKRPGLLKTLVLGDYTVNLGQGLIQWQSLALGKTTEITGIKRQATVLRPHTGSGEYNFHRGAAVGLQKQRFNLAVFISVRKLSANFSMDTNGVASVSSFITGGLHRTATEISRKNNFRQQAMGGNLAYHGNNWHLGASLVRYKFSHPVLKKDEPYNLFALKGSGWSNYSIDYDYTYRNVHLFGEVAVGQGRGAAVVSGLLASLHHKADASVLVRHISPGFQSLYSDAFTENTLPSNESGLFMGLAFRPSRPWRVEGYADVFRFPWLKYRVDAPSQGQEYGLQLSWQPGKKLEIISRLRLERKAQNYPGDEPLQSLWSVERKSWRTHFTWHPHAHLRLRQRVELVRSKAGNQVQRGFIIYNDVDFRPGNWPFRLNARVQMFETDGFNARVAAFENDVPGSYAIPFVHNKGVRYYLNLHVSPAHWLGRRFTAHHKLDLFIRWAHTFYTSPVIMEDRQENLAEYRLQLIFSRE
jgi:hypothetical protein